MFIHTQYDKSVSVDQVSIRYYWIGNGVAELHLFHNPPKVTEISLDSIAFFLLLCQDSLECMPALRSITCFDSSGTALLTMFGVDSTKALYVDLSLKGMSLNQHSSFYICSPFSTRELIVYPQCLFYSTSTTSASVKNKMPIYDTLSSRLPYLRQAHDSVFGRIEREQTLTLSKNTLYSTVYDTLEKFQTFRPYISILGYPKLISVESLYTPLIYLKPDLHEFTSDSIARKYLELFWYKTGNRDFTVSRELMRIYYNRVQLANEFFTSYKEGWKTDRGMVLIILGLANEIVSDINGETWVYYNQGAGEDIIFRFSRISDSPVANDLRLERMNIYEKIWINALNSWRRGDVFNVFN